MVPWEVELCSDVRPTAVEWLWPGYVARGKLALLDGDPEIGKSLVTMDLMARLSRGGPLPDGTPLARPYTSILLSAEDDARDTIRPRAEAAGADLSRLVLSKVGGRVPRFPEDLTALEELIVDRGADLVVMDPFMAFLSPGVAANLDQCVRRVLTPLAHLAAWTGCAVILIRHLTKRWQDRAMLRGQGSAGIIAAVRTALFAGPHPDVGVGAGDGDGSLGDVCAEERRKAELQPPERVLAVAKTNVCRRPPALGYRVGVSDSGQAVVEWTGPVEVTADVLGARRPAGERVKAGDRAVDWLRRELAGGPRTAADLYAAAAAAGIPERTLKRAKDWLEAESKRVYDHQADRAEWYWYDPAAAWPKGAPFKKPLDRRRMWEEEEL